MLKQRSYQLLLSTIAACVVVGILYAYSNRLMSQENGFIRLLPSHKLVGDNSFDIKYNSWYISGIHGNNIYLGNNVLPGHVFQVNRRLNRYKEFNLSGFENLSIHRGAQFQIDSPYIYLMDGIKGIILKGSLDSFHLNRVIKTAYFTGVIPCIDNSFMLRSVYLDSGNVLVKQFKDSNLIRTSLLHKQVDGVFCTDGEMVKIPGSSKMIYVYYYRNQILCADSNLNLLYKGKTIDTISRAKIKVAKIASTGETTMAAPPLLVNKRACANEKYLFVQSALRANNETEYMIKDVSMIDVYAIVDGKYQFSFYLPDFRGFKVRDFKVYGQSLYALYDHYLYKYQLNF